MRDITNQIKKAVYDGTQQIIKPLYTELDNRSVIGKELSYGEFAAGLESTTASATQYIIAKANSYGNITKNDDGTITLKRGTTYKITFNGSVHCSGVSYITLTLCDNNGNLLRTMTYPRTLTYTSNETESGDHSCFYEPTIDINVKLKAYSNVGTIINCYSGKITIEEISRQIIIDPAEESKNLEFDRGYFVTNYTQGFQFSGNSIIKYDRKLNGNLEIDSNGGIILKAGKKYEISFGFQAHSITDGNTSFSLFDLNANEFLPNSAIYLFTSTANYAYNTASSKTLTIETDKDISLVLKEEIGRACCLVESGCFINITEKAHPYYFNYYKDSISSKVLFEGEANASGRYTLTDDLSNYEFIIVESGSTYDNRENYVISQTIHKPEIGTGRVYTNMYLEESNNCHRCCYSFLDDKTMSLNVWYKGFTNAKIYKITGYGFRYDNPYKDIISSGSSSEIDGFEYTDEEVKENLKDIWGDE